VVLLALVLLFAAWRFDVWAYDRGYAAAVAKYTAEEAKARAQANDWLQRAAAMQQSNRDVQAQADAAFQKQQAEIHSHPGGNDPLPPYLANAARRLYP
jgi:glyoxylate carboligase